MKKSVLKCCVSFATLAILGAAAPALAQDAPAEAAEETVGLDEIVVTASGGGRSRLDSAVAVTSVEASLIENFKPASESEIFRLIPGIQAAGTAGPGGNANIAVRGLPVATGGSPFVQLQEDGLPTVLFGDIQFGNNDYWTRYDASVERLESVRGGGATTFTSQAPGAVINYISNTGKVAGGHVQLSKGIDFDDTKLDFRYGAPIGESTRFHIGGFFRTGHGPLNDFKTSESFQVKANITQELGGGAGFVRLLVKFADTQDPNYTGAPALATRNGNKISNIKPFPGFDGREDSNYSSLNRSGLFLTRGGALERQPIDGITTKQFSIGGQLHYELGENITIDNNARWSDMSGHFASPFLNLARTSSIVGSTVNGATVAEVRYANGPNAGQLYTGTYVDNNVNVRTNIRDIGSLANDLKLAGEFELGGVTLTPRAGFFYMKQDIAMDWHVNKSTREVAGDNPAQLDLFDGDGNRLTNEGISGYNNNWGNCCARDYDLSYTNTAPYAALDLEAGPFVLDGSIRFERIKAKGSGRSNVISPELTRTDGSVIPEVAGPTIDQVVNGVTIPSILANGTIERLNYVRTYKSWTVGGLFKASDDLSLFVRASRGGRFNGDRQTFGNKIRDDGKLCTAADQAATQAAIDAGGTTMVNGCKIDGVTPSVDFVKQYEIGLKTRGNIGAGRFTAELSLLKANFKQSTFELSATRCPSTGGTGSGCIIDAQYKSSGAEFFGSYQNGGFMFVANATYSNSKQKGGGAAGYRRASYLPDLTYTLSASYDFDDMVTLGLAATGQTGVRDDPGNVYPGGLILNGNIAVRPVKNLELGLQAYNLFNRLDFRGNGSNVADASVTPIVITGTPVVGRTLSASVRYNF